MRTVIGCCVYEEDGIICIYKAVYDIQPRPDGGTVNRLVYASTKELRFSYDNRNGDHPTPAEVVEILRLNRAESFL
ncbi:MAG: hypothetical protein WCT08_00085 [Patescibacteria group bacterium]|jgi:hypothetical protein